MVRAAVELVAASDEAIAELKTLDPLSLVISADVADVLFAAHRYDEAMQQSRKVIEMDPNFAIAHYELGQALAQTKQYNAAIGELQKANELSAGDTTCVATLAYAYAASGRNDDAIKLLNGLKNRPDHRFSYAAPEALIYASLNDRDQTMALLEKAYNNDFDALALRSPAFDPPRPDPDPRFQNLVHRIGLPQ